MIITSLYRMLKNRTEIYEYQKIPIERLPQLLNEQPDSDYTQKVLTSHMPNLRPTRYPIVLLYRCWRDRRGER